MIAYEYSQPTDWYGEVANTDVHIYRDVTGLAIDADINTPRKNGVGVHVQQCVIATLPDEEGIKLRDYLISVYPL